MEQEKKKGPVVFGLIALGAAVCLSLTLAGSRARGAAVAAAAAVELPKTAAAQPAQTAAGRRVIPLGKAVGIKLFSDGVLEIGRAHV